MPARALNTHFVHTGCVQARRAIGASLLAVALSLANVASAQDDKVVARLNGIDITAADVAVATEMYGNQLGNMPDDARLSVIVDELIALRLAADAAKAANIPDDDSYKRQIAFFEAQTLRSVFLEKEVAKQVDDAAVRKAYDDRIASTPAVEELRLRHILLPTEQEAKDVVVALDGGAEFATLASERSRDEASKPNGGDLGYVTAGQTIAEIDAAAAGLKPGEYAREPVASAFGFHVVKLEDRRSRPAPPFETVAEEIRASLKAAASQKILADLRAAADVEKLVPDVAPPAADDGHDHEAQ
jgi:peptidyl-prolyl cis-trans isomerase C